nr:DUF6147 family protein [uncultured Blautia sp.]
MRKCKRIVSLFLSMFLFFSVGVNVKAANFEDLGKVVDGSRLLNTKESTVTLENLARGNILNNGTASVANNGNGEVNVSGSVLAGVVCDKLLLKMTLQRYSGGYWEDVKYFTDTRYNHSLLTKSYNVSVAKGYYYRVKAACLAYKGSTVESKSPMTNGIWID